MKTLHCPLNGVRNLSEFSYGGEYHPEPENADDKRWAEYVFFHANPAGTVLEWWCHRPSAFWFLAERDTRTDTVIRTLRVTDLDGETS